MSHVRSSARPQNLTNLGFSDAEITSLAVQGHVTREVRGRGIVVYKLRYRFAGRQRVRYLGCEARRAAEIERELAVLQGQTKLNCELQAMSAAARKTLRLSKQRLEPQLREAGYTFHGLAIRRRRRAAIQ